MNGRKVSRHIDTLPQQLEAFVTPSAAEKILTGEVLTDTQRTALWLDGLGISVFPLPYKSKTPVSPTTGAAMPWKRFGLTHHRMRPDAIAPAFAGRCNPAVVTGGVSGDLFVIDCDSNHALDQTISQLQRRNIPVFAVKSARGGHVWLIAQEGEVSNTAAGMIPDIDILGHDKYVLAPPSMHPSGQPYQFHLLECTEPPVVEIEALDWFTDANGKPVVLKYRKTQRRLKPETVKYLEQGAPVGSRNNKFYLAAGELHRAGKDIQPAIDRAQTDGLAEKEIRNTAKSATKNTPRKSSENASYKKALQFAAGYDGWHGRAGSTDKVVFLALCERLRLDSRGRGEFHDDVQFRAAVRELAELSRKSARSVQAALYRLQGMPQTHSGKKVKHAHNPPLIQRMDTNDLGANKWTFTDAVLSRGKAFEPVIATVTHYVSTAICTVATTGFSSDVLEAGALGLNGVLVYETLAQQSEPISIHQLSQLANITLEQAQYALRPNGALRLFKLVECDGKKWTANTLLDKELAFAEIAAKTGKRGAGMKRQARHKLERENRTSDLVIRWRKKHDTNYPGNTAKRRKQAGKTGNEETPTLSEKNA